MSRIEKALEKAAQIRNRQSSESPPAVQPRPAPAQARPDIPPPVNPLAITNRLLVAATEPHSTVAEEYRKLKTLILKMTRGEAFLNTLLVTSAVAGEGKSLTALNLALSLAQEHDHTVLLIDADLRRPSIHRYLGIDPPRGLADCLLDGVDPGEVIIRTGWGNLMVIPAGRSIPNPVELFSSQKMETLLAELKFRYPDRYVLIDSPPAVPFAEVQTLAHLVDGVLYVVKERLASADDIAQGIELLRDSNLLGIVYNDSITALAESSYHYRYRGYGTGSGSAGGGKG